MPLRQLSMSVLFSKCVGPFDIVASSFFGHAEHPVVPSAKLVHTGAAGTALFGFT
jgi:hypothetical protein